MQPASSPWYLLNPLFCEWVRLHVRAFHRKALFLSLSLVIPQFGWISHVSLLKLSSVHSGLVFALNLNYTACTSLSSPMLVVDVSIWATSPLATVVRCLFCVLLLFFSPGYVTF